jgi:hypothetical protein
MRLITWALKAYKAVKHTCSGNFEIAPHKQNSIVNFIGRKICPLANGKSGTDCISTESHRQVRQNRNLTHKT